MSEHLDKGESIDESTTASTAGQSQWSLVKVEKTIFQVMLSINKTMERPSKKWKLLGRLILLFQILGFVVTPQLWHHGLAGGFSLAVAAFQIPVWNVDDFGVSHTGSGIVALVVAFLLFVYFLIWGWMIRSHSKESVRPWTAAILGRATRLLSSVLFIPILRIFAIHLACTGNGSGAGADSFFLTGYPETSCFADPFAIALFTVAALFAFLFTAAVLATTLLIFNPAHSEKFFDNKSSGRVDAISKISTVAMVLAAQFLVDRPVPLVSAFLVYSVANVFLYGVALPYYKSFYNAVAVGTWSAAVGCGLAAVISVATNYGTVGAILLFALLPISFATGFILTRLLHKWRVRYVERKLPDPHADEEAQDESAFARGTYQRRDRNLKEHWPFVFLLEIATRFLLEEPTPENVERAERMLLYQCRYFPSAMAEIIYVQFLVSFKRDFILGRVRVNRAKRLEPTIDERLMLLRLETIFEEERLSDAHGESISAAGLADMRKQLQDARKYHLETLKNFGDFWAELVDEKVDLARLPAVMSRIEHSEDRADFAFGKLLSKFPTSKVVLRAYAQYLDEVKMDEAAAQEYSAKADMLENIRRANAGRSNGSESHENSITEATSTHSRGSGGSSDVLRRIAASGQALELTSRVQSSSAMRLLRITARIMFVGLFIFLIVAFSLLHVDQSHKTAKLSLYSASGNRVSLLMQACVQTRNLQIAAMLAINDSTLLPAVDAAKVTLSETLLRFEYEHKRASIGLDGTVASDYSAQATLITDRTITLMQLVERQPPLLQQRLVNVIDGGLLFIENAAQLLEYSLDELRTMDDDPAFRFIVDNGPDTLLTVFKYSNDLLVEEEEDADASFKVTLIVLLVVFCLLLNVPGWVMFQNVFDGIREERNFALNLFLLIPKTVIRHMLKEKKFQQNTQKNAGPAHDANEQVLDETATAPKNADADDGKGTKASPRTPRLEPLTERPSDFVLHSERRQVSFDPQPGPSRAALEPDNDSGDESGEATNETALADSNSLGDRPHSTPGRTGMWMSQPLLNSHGSAEGGVFDGGVFSASDNGRVQRPDDDDTPLTTQSARSPPREERKRRSRGKAEAAIPEARKEEELAVEAEKRKAEEQKAQAEKAAAEKAEAEKATEAAKAKEDTKEQPKEEVVEVAVRKRRCGCLQRSRSGQESKRGALSMSLMLAVMIISVLLQLAVTIPLLMLPAAQTAVVSQYDDMRTSSLHYVTLLNASEMRYSREFIQTGDAKSYEAYEDFRGGNMIESAVTGLRKLHLPIEASESLGQFLALQNKAQHRTRIAVALTLLRAKVKPIRNYLSLEYPWDIQEETDVREIFLQYPTLKNRYTNRTYDSTLPPAEMAKVAKQCINGGVYKDLKKQIKAAVITARDGTYADQLSDLSELVEHGVSLANVAIGLVPAFLVSVLIMALFIRVQVVTHFAKGELPSATSWLMIGVFATLFLAGSVCAIGVRVIEDETDHAVDPAQAAVLTVSKASTAYFTVTEAMRAVRDFADNGDAASFSSFTSARDRAWIAINGLDTTDTTAQAPAVEKIKAAFAPMDRTLSIATVLIRGGLGVDPTIMGAMNDYTWDAKTESDYQTTRLTYADIALAYTNRTGDMQLSPAQQLALASSIIYDRRFIDMLMAVTYAIGEYQTTTLDYEDSEGASRQASLTRLTYGFVGISGALVVVAFLGYWSSYVIIARHIKSKSSSIIKQHVEVPSAKRTARNFTILSIVGTVLVVAFFVSALQLMTYSSGSAWRMQQAVSRATSVNSVMFFASELFETFRGFPQWSPELAASKDSGDLKLLQHINVIPTAVRLRRKLSEITTSAGTAKDSLMFGDSAHPDLGHFGKSPQQTAFQFNTGCVVSTYRTLSSTGEYIAPSRCASPVFTSAHRGSGGMHVLYIRFLDASLALLDNVADATSLGDAVTTTIEWMREAVAPLSTLIIASTDIIYADLAAKLSLTQTLNIVVFVVCGLFLAVLFFAYAQRWIKEIALEEVRTKGMLDMIPEDAFVIDGEKDKTDATTV